MKDNWDIKDSKLVINDRITETGKTNYWAAIDATFCFNVQRREVFLAKSAVSAQSVNTKCLVQRDTDVKSEFSTDQIRSSGESSFSRWQCSSNIGRLSSDRHRSEFSGRDPMFTFFDRHRARESHGDSHFRNVEHYTGVREDQHFSRRFEDDYRPNNRFFLPRLR